MIFDTWGGALTPAAYQAFSLDYMQRIIQGLTREAEGRQVPVILFTKGGGLWLERMARERLRCTRASTGPSHLARGAPARRLTR